ncbi:hypothetical protein DDZ15_04760 [Rhodohalobacter mucosus]|uniref:Uncharacterized protein n=1 Tax=Rhodohalobacter mucosus TaxID=2079485 RepID=A0A316TUZ8_9BACT|nr:hypothetical protein DDZ15_04760 [Rhodohalobacter mucosus]
MRINIFKETIYTPLIQFLTVCAFLFFFPLFPASHSFAQNSLTGLYQNYNALQTTPEYEIIAARNRFRLQLNRSISGGSFQSETDIIHRYAQRAEAEVLIRELYFELYFDKSDLRIGKQVINWGRSNGAFVTGILSPLDLSEFLTQDPSDLILGVTSLNYIRYFGSNSLQFVFAPVFEKDRFPSPDSRWFPLQTIDAPLPVRYRTYESERPATDMQAALRYSLRSPDSVDLDLMLYYWTHPMPSFSLTVELFNDFPEPPSVDLSETYRVSPMAGYSLNWQLGDNFSLLSESLFVTDALFTFLPVSVNRLEDALESTTDALLVLQEFELRNDGYLLTKPWLQSMAGLQSEVAGTTISLQGYLETIFKYEDRILPQQFFPYATLFMNRSFLRDRLQVITGGRYNFFGNDFWVQLQGVYELDDGLELSAGVNLFGGKEISPFYGHFTFNQFRDNSFLFSKISLYF